MNASPPTSTTTTAPHPLLGLEVTDPDSATRSFRGRITAQSPAYLADHSFRGRPFLSASAYLEIAFAAAAAAYGDPGRAIRDIRFTEALFLGNEPTDVLTHVTPKPDGTSVLHICGSSAHSQPGASAERAHATATILGSTTERAGLTHTGQELLRHAAEVRKPDAVLLAEDVYAVYRAAGLDYGPQFRRVNQVARYGTDFAIGEVRGMPGPEFVPPPVLDGATHGLAALIDTEYDYVSTGIARAQALGTPRSRSMRALARTTQISGLIGADPAFTMDVLLLDGEEPIAELTGMRFRRLGRRMVGSLPA